MSRHKSSSGKTRKSNVAGQSAGWQSLIRSRWFQESSGIFLMAFSIYLALSLLSGLEIAGNLPDFCGNFGCRMAGFLWSTIGICSVVIPLVIGIWGFMAFRYRRIERWLSRLLGVALLIPSAATLFGAYRSYHYGRQSEYVLSGRAGQSIHLFFSNYLGPLGTQILMVSVVLIAVLLSTDISFYLMSKKAKNRFIDLWLIGLEIIRTRHIKRRERYALKKEQKTKKQALDLEERNALRLDQAEILPVISGSGQPENTDPDDLMDSIMQDAAETDIFQEEPVALIKTIPVDYQPPALDLLEDPPRDSHTETEEELLRKSEILIQKLRDFNIQGHITEVCPGPVITRYEFEPAPGIKISKIIGLSSDLALGLKSKYGLRVAPVPGKSTLGIEVPNLYREIVHLKELLVSEQFKTSVKKSILSIPLGKTTAGQPYIADLKRMPHLLIAGATGSGKSVCINSILCGLMFSTTPSQLRLILIDPKMLELSDFNGIPHLREPVITDVKMAPEALNWAIGEMNNRYVKLSELGVRNIDQFNQKITSPDYEGCEEPIPYLVVVVDELADLMLTSPSIVEEGIQRLAQMARASGIHLIIATQRPSVDVITGVIKANLPCRLAFQVTSRVDSRTILDSIGAEKLLGMGDCLFIPPGTSQIIRLHGAFVSESEIKRVVGFLNRQAVEVEEESIFQCFQAGPGEGENADDPLYDQAVKLVLTSGLASISMLQRRLKVGHSRASRLIDFMELNGIVGPFEGSKPRDILVDPEEYLERMNQMKEDQMDE
ncbi:DNA translocase FtsK [bacterium]|nr:DNA translocase FtsK [candidate division CSSED10-310 bacterium]